MSVTPFPAGSSDHIQLLAGGYGMTLEEAQHVVEARKANPVSYPFEVGRAAQAMIDATQSKGAKPVSKRPGWRRNDDLPLYGEEN